MKMADKKEAVLGWMRHRPGVWISPTEIGMKALGLRYDRVSSRTSPVCKMLVANGYLERNGRGHYRLRGAE